MKQNQTLRAAGLLLALALVTVVILLLPVWYERLQEPRLTRVRTETLGLESLQSAAATTAQTLALLADPDTVWTDLSEQTGEARVQEVGQQFAELWVQRARRRELGWETAWQPPDPLEILLYGGDPDLVSALTFTGADWALVSLRGTVEGRACSALLWCLAYELRCEWYGMGMDAARVSVLADPAAGVVYRASLVRRTESLKEVWGKEIAEVDGWLLYDPDALAQDKTMQTEALRVAADYWGCEPPEGLWPVLTCGRTEDAVWLDFGGAADLERLSRGF